MRISAPSSSGTGRDPYGCIRRGWCRAASLCAELFDASGSRPGGCFRRRRGAGGRAVSGDLRRAGGSLRQGLVGTAGVGGVVERAGDHQVGGKERIRRGSPAGSRCRGKATTLEVRRFLDDADVVFGIGCSFATTGFGVRMPTGKIFIHATLDPADLNKDLEVRHPLVGDAQVVLQALLGEPKGRTLPRRPPGGIPPAGSAVSIGDGFRTGCPSCPRTSSRPRRIVF